VLQAPFPFTEPHPGDGALSYATPKPQNRFLCVRRKSPYNVDMSSKVAKSRVETQKARQVEESSKDRAMVIETDVDGKRVRIVAKDEIVLECGKASITLRRNGRVIVRGTHVETNSDGTNRIKGGQVQIN
jgi:hypothetical protein